MLNITQWASYCGATMDGAAATSSLYPVRIKKYPGRTESFCATSSLQMEGIIGGKTQILQHPTLSPGVKNKNSRKYKF